MLVTLKCDIGIAFIHSISDVPNDCEYNHRQSNMPKYAEYKHRQLNRPKYNTFGLEFFVCKIQLSKLFTYLHSYIL